MSEELHTTAVSEPRESRVSSPITILQGLGALCALIGFLVVYLAIPMMGQRDDTRALTAKMSGYDDLVKTVQSQGSRLDRFDQIKVQRDQEISDLRQQSQIQNGQISQMSSQLASINANLQDIKLWLEEWRRSGTK